MGHVANATYCNNNNTDKSPASDKSLGSFSLLCFYAMALVVVGGGGGGGVKMTLPEHDSRL